MQEYIIDAYSGKSFNVSEGQILTLIDVEGGQVADFFAEDLNDAEQFLSTAVTIDCNESIRMNVGDTIYLNTYQPMFVVLKDDVGRHDLLFPCCRPEMYDFFYSNGKDHPNCYDNINSSLGKKEV